MMLRHHSFQSFYVEDNSEEDFDWVQEYRQQHLGLDIHDPGGRYPSITMKHRVVQQVSELSHATNETKLSNWKVSNRY